MAKYKIVATGPVTFDRTTAAGRLWIDTERTGTRIISVAGVAYEDIPEMSNAYDMRSLGRYTGGPINSVAVRPDLSRDDFEVEIVNG